MNHLMIIAMLIFTSQIEAKLVPTETFERLQKIYPHQTKEFLQQRLTNAEGIFEKWRSFPPYFYDMVKRSKLLVNLTPRKGLCTGDPHLENFGFLPLKNDSVHFGLNDLDDVTYCPLDLDLVRLYLAHKFNGPEFSIEDFYKSYQSGLAGETCKEPAYVKNLEKDALKKGRGLSKKAMKMLEEKNCAGEFSFIPDEEMRQILLLIQKSSPVPVSFKVLHACSRLKTHGGSAGEKRFIFFLQDEKNNISHIELKPLVNPAPDVGTPFNIEKRKDLFLKSVRVFYGDELLQEYFTVAYQNKLYQRRPLWAGVQEVSRDDLLKLPTEEKQEILNFEACILGVHHRKTSTGPLAFKLSQFEALAKAWEKQFRAEMGHL